MSSTLSLTGLANDVYEARAYRSPGPTAGASQPGILAGNPDLERSRYAEGGFSGKRGETAQGAPRSPNMEESESQQESRLEDSVLVNSAQAGDTEAFDALVLRHSAKLYGLVFHMTSSHEDTDDLLQEIWAKVYRSLSSFRGASRFSTWLHSIAVHMTLNFLKRRSRRTTVSLDAASPGAGGAGGGAAAEGADFGWGGGGLGGGLRITEEGLVNTQTPHSETHLSELQARLSQALDQLSPEHRAVVSMFDIQGIPHSEIARIMGVSEGTVRSRLFYAHRQLQSLLSDLADEFFPAPTHLPAS